MKLTLKAFSSLLRGLNMLSIAVVRTKEPGPSVDFQLEDLPRIAPTRCGRTTVIDRGETAILKAT